MATNKEIKTNTADDSSLSLGGILSGFADVGSVSGCRSWTVVFFCLFLLLFCTPNRSPQHTNYKRAERPLGDGCNLPAAFQKHCHHLLKAYCSACTRAQSCCMKQYPQPQLAVKAGQPTLVSLLTALLVDTERQCLLFCRNKRCTANISVEPRLVYK